METHRTVSPEDTLKRIDSLVSLTGGVTQVEDITDVDRLGIPVFTCTRRGGINGKEFVHNGKGATPVAARVSAMMETIERYSAEADDREMIVGGSYSELSGEYLLLSPGRDDPAGIYGSKCCDLLGVAHDIIRDEAILVPAHEVFHPPLDASYGNFIRTHTNGIASGNTLEEAVFHALAELIERDAWSLAEVTRNAGPVVGDITDERCLQVIESFQKEGVEVIVRDITSDIRLPTIVAICDDVKLKDPALLCTGAGTHVCPEIAVLRALTEVAQSRATQLFVDGTKPTGGADMRRVMGGYDRTKRMNKRWFAKDTESVYGNIGGAFRSDDFLTDIEYVLDELKKAGLGRCIVADLTREEIGVPVVRVIVPGLEVLTMDTDRIGQRCRDAAKNGYQPGVWN
ncbi:YcaO-related McrA-glycine thioamidation protein [Methanogenium cariaci]|uniref:YcaO-related McrA-glycine thioamidation protein n=1 Tax=Methanogenium cariaci TaxID=2197 RepID=UPI001FDFDB61|nr:YcaO-related McrA-glycine thioamidation protein [Methanogenium cariaci]